MSIDRVTHLLEQMHRSEDDMGNPIAADKVLVTDGTGGHTYEDYGGGGAGLDSDIVRWLDLGLSGSAFTVDWADAPSQYVELDDDTTATLTGLPATVDGDTVEGRGRLWIETDGTHTVTWPVTVVWQDSAPDLSVAGLYFVDFLTFDGGTNLYGVFGGSGSGVDPATTVEDETMFGIAPAVGTDLEYARQDHTHGTPDTDAVKDAGRWEHAVITGSPPDDLYADGDWLYIWVP